MFTLLFNLWQGITDLFNAVIGAISFLIHTITSMVSFVAHIPAYISFTTSAINVLPAMLIPFAVAGISAYVVLFIINR